MQFDNIINPKYKRVLPRDLFNEAKLLKCVGRLTLLIHDELTIYGFTFSHDGKPFIIGRNESDGSITVLNIMFYINRIELIFKTSLNAKDNYPFYCEFESEDYLVFNEDGEYTQEFMELCSNLKG